jgi:hypothetical protein
MSNPEFEYHMLVDVINEAARRGDGRNVLRLGDLGETLFEQALAAGYLPASSYQEGRATEQFNNTVDTQTN